MNKTAKKILLKTKKQVYGDMLGNNASLFHGEGFEFAELREYIYGDDVRKIDWKTTAKLGKPYVKIYHEERELNVAVVSVLGGSVYFGTHQQKQDSIAKVVSTIGYSAVKNSDLFSHYIVADKLYDIQKPTKKLYGVKKAVESIVEFESLGKNCDFAMVTQMIKDRIKKKSLLFIVSDFVGEFDLKLLSKKHDIVAVIVRDRFEEDPSELGYLQLIDPATKARFEANIDSSTLKAYKKALYENDERLYKQFKKNSIRFVKVYTDEDAGLKLAKGLRG